MRLDNPVIGPLRIRYVPANGMPGRWVQERTASEHRGRTYTDLDLPFLPDAQELSERGYRRDGDAWVKAIAESRRESRRA